MKISTMNTMKTMELGRITNSTYPKKQIRRTMEFVYESMAQIYGLGCVDCWHYSEMQECEFERGCEIEFIKNCIICANNKKGKLA